MTVRLNPTGFCECGCGLRAPIAKKTVVKFGHIKGYPKRFVVGHHRRAQRRFPLPYLPDEETGCWEWQWGRSPAGYGRVYDGQRMVLAHRQYYERVKGPIPMGLELDHRCRNRACVNPDHLEPVTHRENMLRGNTLAAKQAAQTHCARGHAFTAENTIVNGRKRRCRECQRRAMREGKQRYLTKLREQRRNERRLLGQRQRSSVDYVVDEATGCWVWQRSLTIYGYGIKQLHGAQMGAHRAYFIMHKGQIPDGLELDHLCRNKACVNPDHLEPVTRQENMRRFHAQRGGEP